MKYKEIDDFIIENDLLSTIAAQAGIYAITINDFIVYVGMSKNCYQRCCQHIYNMNNAMLNNEKKYELLLSAKLGGYKVDCIQLETCEEYELRELEDRWIEQLMPPLNIQTPLGKNDISNLTILGLIYKLTYRVDLENSKIYYNKFMED